MRNANNSFSKDIDGLSQKLTALNKTKTTLTVDTENAKRALRDAQKAFKAMDDTAKDDTALKIAIDNYDNVRRNLKLVADEARNTEKALINFGDTQSKAENRAGSAGGVLNKLATAGVGTLLTGTFTDLADAGISSALGATQGNAIASIISGMATGAVMGSIAGPWGTLIGGAAGLASGTINAGTQIFQANDEAFKGVVQDQYNGVAQRQQDDISVGSNIAAGRETSLVAFSTLFGDEGKARNYLNQMKTMANTTPFLYDDLAQMSKVLKTYGYSDTEMLPQLAKIGDTGAALGLSTQDMSMVTQALGRMNSSGKTSLEYLNPLIERGIPAMDYLAAASGKSKEQIYDMVSKGLIPGAEAAKAISDYMGDAFGGSMERQSKTFSGLQSTLQGMKEEQQNAYGEGFNSQRTVGMQDEISYLSGDGGRQRQAVNSFVGEYQASILNLQEQYQRETESAIMTGSMGELFSSRGEDDPAAARLRELSDAYASLSTQRVNLEDTLMSRTMDETQRESINEKMRKLGSEMGKILQEGQVMAQAEYNASEGTQAEVASQLALITSIQGDLSLKDEYWNTGKIFGTKFSQGLASVIKELNPLFDYPEWSATYNDLSQPMVITNHDMTESGEARMVSHEVSSKYISGNAYGLRYVPRDNYMARLHEGERVLTAQESRTYQEGGAPVTITGNSFTVREEADIYKIAQALVDEIRMAQQIS